MPGPCLTLSRVLDELLVEIDCVVLYSQTMGLKTKSATRRKGRGQCSMAFYAGTSVKSGFTPYNTRTNVDA